MPRYTPLAARLPASVPFVGPETQERATGRAFRARLGANESPFGPAPRAIAAMAAAAAEIWKYGDPEMHDLRQAIADHHGTGAANVMVGEGIDGLLCTLCRLLVAEGTPVVTSDGAYPTFAFHVAGCGGHLVKVPYRDDREDPEALLDALRATGAGLVYLANPDNPMGTWHPAATVEAMVAALPGDALLILDEAYVDFAPEGTAPAIDPGDPRVLRLRTFSKAYGMAGARVGYAIGAPDLIRSFDKLRNHFGVGRLAQAGALAAIGDQDWLRHVVEQVGASRDRIASVGRQNGLAPVDSATNFVALDCGGDGALARRVLAELTRRGLFVRMPAAAPLDRCIRVTAGLPSEVELLAEALPAALAAARA